MRAWPLLAAALAALVAACAADALDIAALDAVLDDRYTCGSTCSSDFECMSDRTNPCTFCLSGQCQTMCGVGCRDDSDCEGGYNPCTKCNEKRVCANPAPHCGTFCGGQDLACRFVGTGPCAGVDGQCCTCHPTDPTLGCGSWNDQCSTSCSSDSDCRAKSGDCTICENGRCIKPTPCGTVCSYTGMCENNPDCPECVGFYCSKKTDCGQVCVSSAQCQHNPKCKACIGAVCSPLRGCGESCGGDDWCGSSCSKCEWAKCS